MSEHVEVRPVRQGEAHERAERPGRPLAISVRTLSGHQLEDHVCAGERVHDVAAGAVRYFVSRGELAAGRYELTLPRLDAAAEIDQRGTIGEVGVVSGDVLVLISAAPQVDGASRPGRKHGHAAR